MTLSFYECDPTEDSGLSPSSMENCMRIVRLAAHSMCDGEIPLDHTRRLGLLFAAVSKCTIETWRQGHTAVENGEAPAEIVTAASNVAMAGLIAAAVAWADGLHAHSAPEFSSN